MFVRLPGFPEPACAALLEHQAHSFDAHGAVHGLRQPIMLFGGEILDGVHRYAACLEAGVEPHFQEFKGTEADALFYVLSMMKGRSWTSGQRACMALEILPLLEEQARERQEGGQKIDEGERGRALDKAADLVGSNRQYVWEARRIRKEEPEIFQALWLGYTSMSEAKKAVEAREAQDD